MIDTAKKNIDYMIDGYEKINQNKLSLDENEKEANALISSIKPEIEKVKDNARAIELSANESKRSKNLTDEMRIEASKCLLSLHKTRLEFKHGNHFLGEKRKRAEVIKEITLRAARTCEVTLKKIKNLEENLLS